MCLIAEFFISSKASESTESSGPPATAAAPGCDPKRNYSSKFAVTSQTAAEQEGRNLPLVHNLMQIIHMVLLRI